MSTHTVAVIPAAIPAQTLSAVTMVGKVVTFDHQQYKVYSVEGYDYYAFQSSVGDTITCDFNMTPADHKRQPLVFLLPMGCKIGQGFGFEVYLHQVKAGVSLSKRQPHWGSCH